MTTIAPLSPEIRAETHATWIKLNPNLRGEGPWVRENELAMQKRFSFIQQSNAAVCRDVVCNHLWIQQIGVHYFRA